MRNTYIEDHNSFGKLARQQNRIPCGLKRALEQRNQEGVKIL
jgi:hypothetical protein